MKKFLIIPVLFFCSFFFADEAQGAIAFDAYTTGTAHAAALTFAHTVTGSDTILFYAENGHSSMPITGVTWNGSAMAKAVTKDGGAGSYTAIWYIVNPDTGTHNVVATSANADHWHDGGAISYTGVLQTTPINATGTSPFAASAESYSGSVTTVVDNSWVLWALANGSNNAMTAGANTYKRFQWFLAIPLGVFDTNSAQTPAGSKTLTLTSAAQQYSQGALVSFSPIADITPPNKQYSQQFCSCEE